MALKDFKEDIKKDINLLGEFYSNPKKHLKKVPLIVIFMTFAYMGIFFEIMKHINSLELNVLETLGIEFTYIISGYFILNKTFDFYKNKERE